MTQASEPQSPDALARQLRESEDRFRALVAATSQLVWTTPPDGQVEDIPLWRAFTGQTPDEVRGWGWLDAVHPDDRPQVAARWQRAVSTRELYENEYRLRRADGVYQFFLVRGVPVITADGAVREWVGVHTDITERKRVEDERAALLRRERTSRATAENAQQRLAFQAEASTLLASSLDVAQTFDSIVQLCVPYLADYCYIDLLAADGSIERLTPAHSSDGTGAQLERMRGTYPFGAVAEHPALRALRTGRTVLMERITDDVLVASSPNPAYLEDLRRLAPVSALSVPLRVHERIVGALSLVTSTSGRHYTEADLALAEDLGQRAAIALDRARLYRETEAALHREGESAERLRKQATELDTVIEAIPDGVYVADAAGQLVRVNARGAALFGLSPAEMLLPEHAPATVPLYTPEGKRIAPEDSPLVQALRGVVRADMRLVIGVGDVAHWQHVLCSFAPLRNEAREITGAVVVASDITEIERLERQKDDFLSIASHELKTPLTSLKILTQLATRRMTQAGLTEAQYTQRMERSIERMERLITDLLDVSRIQAGKLALHVEECDLTQLVTQIASELCAVSGRRIALHLPAEPLRARVDADRIGQVLVNLLTNALKYSPQQRAVRLTLARYGAQVRIGVRDYGGGIPAEALPHLFERFYRVPEVQVQSGSGVGMGLGLFISREIIERHGGAIGAESVPGKGAAFWFTLPLDCR